MISRFKSAINQIKAEEALISRTEGFLKDALMNENTTNIKYSHRRTFFMKKKLIAAACAATLLVGGSGAAYAYYQTPVSYLSLDINPSVEIGVNAFDKVVKVKGINDDGNKILAKISIKGSNVRVAVSTLVYSAVDNGFIADNGSSVVSITSETDNSKTAAKLENDAETGANQALEESDTTATVIKDNVALARRDQARALGISPGKLNLINKLQKVDPTATVDKYKDASVKDIMKTIKDSKDKLKNNADHKDENKDQTNSTTADNNTNTSTTTTGTAADSSEAKNTNAAKINNASKANEQEVKISDEDKDSKENNAASVTNKSKKDDDAANDKNIEDNKNQGATKSNAAAQGNKKSDGNKNSAANKNSDVKDKNSDEKDKNGL
ncbi:hypothetical protein [Paenibacillus sp. NFR01]|uniref:anti-sigma-I factor RsgI family protein n=1 Tax=Paenibacillus sp. NFR01 TaxID=1566279 RepID=UPI0008BD615E|nr:hypothetical protein [Paenibacillus sp. NFR01]SEU27577.1 hypothetical protein SAMN03159358_4589 [Paenibacillus sp. NFR01]